MKKIPSPPNIALLLLRLTLPDDVKESVIGDLEEEMAALSEWKSLHVRFWFFWQAIVISGHYFVERRLRQPLRRPISSLEWAGQECLVSGKTYTTGCGS
jgi:hypothetical protein